MVGGPWVFHEAKAARFYSTATSGKWCTTCAPEAVDDAWQAIRRLLDQGSLLAAVYRALGVLRQAGQRAMDLNLLSVTVES